MLWPHARFRRPRNVETRQRVAQARRENPEAEAWLGLLEAALGESDDGARWEAAAPKPAADRPVKAPLLSRAEITVDGRVVRGWVRRLLRGAMRTNARAVDGLALLEAAVCQDDARIDGLAAAAGADPHAVRVVGQMAALPLLQACARALARDLPATWWESYCPLCGAWPVVAEYTGLERKRQLRCGRCGTGWAIPWLRCAFCDESHHENLGYLTPEQGEPMRKVEVCKTCKGYLKGLTTVRPLAPWAILLDDLTTVHLDVAAVERGYGRPERPGYALEARIGEQARVGGWWRWSPTSLHDLHQPSRGGGA
jgi:FdhE protein